MSYWLRVFYDVKKSLLSKHCQMKLQFPKVHTDSLHKVFVSFYINDTRYRLYNGKRINSTTDPNSYPIEQRLSIARLFLKNPEILILDEATSALDNKTEKLIQKALDKLMKWRTSIVIAHRLSTIVRSDKIVVLDYGQLVEEGNHKELLALDGKYANMYRSQIGEV